VREKDRGREAEVERGAPRAKSGRRGGPAPAAKAAATPGAPCSSALRTSSSAMDTVAMTPMATPSSCASSASSGLRMICGGGAPGFRRRRAARGRERESCWRQRQPTAAASAEQRLRCGCHGLGRKSQCRWGGGGMATGARDSARLRRPHRQRAADGRRQPRQRGQRQRVAPVAIRQGAHMERLRLSHGRGQRGRERGRRRRDGAAAATPRGSARRRGRRAAGGRRRRGAGREAGARGWLCASLASCGGER
jgi:hypothetical protein